MGKDQDLRVTKTRRALAFAMLTLLERESFAKISVNEICKEALVSRSTFYSHFEDKYTLLRFCLKEIKDNFIQHLPGKTIAEHLYDILTYIRDHDKVFRHIFLTDVSEEMTVMFRNLFVKDFTLAIEQCEQGSGELPAPAPLLAVFYGSGLASTVMWWIGSDYPLTVQEMAEGQSALLKNVCPVIEDVCPTIDGGLHP